jgi:large subunit ribosomal protein L18
MKSKGSQRRKIRVRSKIIGTPKRPRLSVFRSHKHLYAQIINDEKQQTLISASETELAPKDKSASNASKAKLLGEIIAQKALNANIKKVVFDRGPYQYHGRVKIFADAARSKGLIF